MKIDISIITVSRNSNNLDKLIETITRSDLCDISVEVLCGWNGEDLYKCNIEPLPFPVQIFEMKPYHFSKNNNLLATYAVGKFLLFINDDIELDVDCLKLTFNEIIRPDIGIVGANLRFPSGLSQHAGVFFNKDNSPYHRYKHQLDYRDPRITKTQVVPAVTGAFLMIDRHEFNSIQFSEECQIAGQDIVLCLKYSRLFSKDILYVGEATALHKENDTRRLVGMRQTLASEIELIKENKVSVSTPDLAMNLDKIRLRIVTEKPGWIMHRMAKEIADRLPNAKINEDYPEANIHYYINYGYFLKLPEQGLVVSNFTHFDDSKLSDRWEWSAINSDHCVAISKLTADDLYKFDIPQKKVSVIPIGADESFKPKLTLGIVGRTYDGGRKGEHLVKALLEDQELMEDIQIVAKNDGWGVPVWNFFNHHEFYRAIDYLLIPAIKEGGPVPFMEALACGTMSIAPAIGVIPDFPYIHYEVGQIESLKKTIARIKTEFLERKYRLASFMEPYNWDTWANKHIALFHQLVTMESMYKYPRLEQAPSVH